jgi:hypothetical protein
MKSMGEKQGKGSLLSLDIDDTERTGNARTKEERRTAYPDHQSYSLLIPVKRSIAQVVHI